MAHIKQRDLIAEIWKSKLSYCQISDNDFTTPDVIVSELHTITTPGLTIRHDTHSLIPLANEADVGRGKLGHLEGAISFEPFILYRSEVCPRGMIWYRETARSHYRNGEFSPDHGRLTNALGRMLIQLVDGYASRGSWRGYSWVDEMKSEALLNLSQHVLKFNEAKTSNAHAYITRCVQTTFIRELRKQKKQGQIRDQIMFINGMTPSFGFVADPPTKQKPGRPKKN